MENLEAPCVAKANTLMKLAIKKGGEIPSFDFLMDQCLHNSAEKEPKYDACWTRSLQELTAAVRNLCIFGEEAPGP